jgi:hypothetical protein
MILVETSPLLSNTAFNLFLERIMKSILRIFTLISILASISFLSGCKKDDPKPEDVPELTTKATLTFTPSGTAGSPIVVTATDPDNLGPQDLVVDSPINLATSTTYSLSIQLVNALYKPTEDGYDISKEIEKEADEHQFFFSWNTGLFSDPSGDGNIDNRSDPLNYGSSFDSHGLPVGLTTVWTTGTAASSGTNSFRILLKHQPDIKSNTSTSNDGESDLDVTFKINVN